MTKAIPAEPPEFFLVSARLGFRAWRDDDLELAMSLWGDPKVTRLIDARGRLSREQVLERLQKEMQTQKEHGMQYWPVFWRYGKGLAGCCGLRPYDPGQGVFEIGVHILARHWRKGLAREASLAVMAHAFDSLGATALFAGHNPRNQASRDLLTKLGFRFWREEFYEPTGLMHPSYLLKAEDYRNRPHD